MKMSLRPYATAGVALVGASAIAIAPMAVAPPMPDIKVANPAVELSASVDPLERWLEVIEAAGTNADALADAWLEAPLPVLQQVIANQLSYFEQIPDFPAIVEQMVGNLEAALRTPFAFDEDAIDPLHHLIYNVLLDGLPPLIDPIVPENLRPILEPILALTTTYTSGILLGLVGPVAGPAVAVFNNAGEIFNNLTGESPDLEAALATLINTPADMADAFLNGGQTLDFTPLLEALPVELNTLNGLGITFGGLFSPGGSLFNALDILVLDGALQIPGQGPGAIGSLIGLTQAIAQAIGWSGEGSPLAPPEEDAEEDADPAQDAAAQTSGVADTSILSSRTVPVQTSVPTEELATAEESADSANGSIADEALASKQDDADNATKSQPSLKIDGAGSRVNGALERVSERIGSQTPSVGSSPRKAVERITGNAENIGTGANKSSPNRTSESTTSSSTASSSSSSVSTSDNDSSADD